MSTEPLSREKLLALGWTEAEIDDLDRCSDGVADAAAVARRTSDRACTRCGGAGILYILDGKYGTFECPNCKCARHDDPAPMPQRLPQRR
jgi:hypothetical protein